MFEKIYLNDILENFKLHLLSMVFRNELLTSLKYNERLKNGDSIDIFNIENNKCIGYFGKIIKKEFKLTKKINFIDYQDMMNYINVHYMRKPVFLK